MQGCLKVAVLKILSQQEMSGYSLTKSINEHTKGWKPSCGSIYPLLERLHNDQLIEAKQSGRKKLYRVTQLGKKELSRLIDEHKKIVGHVIEELRVLELINSKAKTKDLLENMARKLEGIA